MKITPVILAGGSGTRLWPLSRPDLPKPFLALAGRAHSLFQEAALRVADRACFAAPLVLVNAAHAAVAEDQLRAIGVADATLIVEPVSRNTGAAVALAALYASKREQSGALLVLPADHLVADGAAFAQALMAGLPQAEAGHIVTFTAPVVGYEPGYGYIRYGAAVSGAPGLFHIDRFVEKPDAAEFTRLCADGAAGVNCGMFLLTAEMALAELARHAPELLRCCRAAYGAGLHQRRCFLPDSAPLAACAALPFDRAVMERTTRGMVIPVAMGWADIGTAGALAQLVPSASQGNQAFGAVHTQEVSGALLYSDGPFIAALGVTDVVVLASAGGVLVAAKDKLDTLPELLARLPSTGPLPYPAATRAADAVLKPWGCFYLLDRGPGYQVKRLHIKPGARISLQSHAQRSEHWHVLRGQATVTHEGETRLLKEGESIFIPAGAVHRLANPEPQELVVIELQYGAYLGEDDIVRLDDCYNRG